MIINLTIQAGWITVTQIQHFLINTKCTLTDRLQWWVLDLIGAVTFRSDPGAKELTYDLTNTGL